MKKDYTDITILMDRSGSMASCRRQTVDSINEFIKGQKSLPGDCRLSLYFFDSKTTGELDLIETRSEQDIQLIEDLMLDEFEPRGMTPLIDAMLTTIEKTGNRLKEKKEEDRPEKVLFVVFTDGQENSSKRLAKELADTVAHQRDVYNWMIVFNGTDEKSVTDAINQYGIDAKNTLFSSSVEESMMNLKVASVSYRKSSAKNLSGFYG